MIGLLAKCLSRSLSTSDISGLPSGQAIAVIPARGGSQRILAKNVKNFNGAPMIVWPIRAAENSGAFSRIVVSTDDQEIASIAREAGAETPFQRPTELSGHNVGAAPVVRHAIESLGLSHTTQVANIYPTSPLPPVVIREGVALHEANPHHFVIGVGKFRTPIERALRLDDGLMSHRDLDAALVRTQDLPESYFDAGKFHIATVAVWRANETMMSRPFIPYFLPDFAAVDIDEPGDWEIAEALHRVFVLGEMA